MISIFTVIALFSVVFFSIFGKTSVNFEKLLTFSINLRQFQISIKKLVEQLKSEKAFTEKQNNKYMSYNPTSR